MASRCLEAFRGAILGQKVEKFHVLRTDRRAGVGLHSVVAEESCYGMLNRIWFDVLASTFEMYGRFPCGMTPQAILVR